MEPPPRTRETAWLDGLRGVAALLVVLQHTHPAALWLGFCDDATLASSARWAPATWPLLRLLFTGGSLAVEVFFLISGYVVPRRLLSLLHQARRDDFIDALNSAVVRRPGRLLLPAMMTTLVMAVFFHLTRVQPPWKEPAGNVFGELRLWLFDCLQLADFYSTYASRYLLITWTIVVEWRGSMAVFMWLFAVHQLPLQWRAALTLTLVLYLAMFTISTQYAAFFAGMLTCELDLLRASGEKVRLRLPWTPISAYLAERKAARILAMHAILAAGILLASTPLLRSQLPTSREAIDNCANWPSLLYNVVPTQYWKKYPGIQYRDFWYFWAAWLMLIGVKEVKWARAGLESRIAQYLGRHSFALYLTHTMVTSTLTRMLLILTGHAFVKGDDAAWPFTAIPTGAWAAWLPHDVGPTAYQPAALFTLAATLAVAFPLAELGTRVLDRPSVAMSNWMWRKFQHMR